MPPDHTMRERLVAELLAMKEVGIRVSDQTIDHARTDDLAEYQGISSGELASLFCELYNA